MKMCIMDVSGWGGGGERREVQAPTCWVIHRCLLASVDCGKGTRGPKPGSPGLELQIFLT